MNIKITIDAPELASAIEKLAAAMSGFALPVTLPDKPVLTAKEAEAAIEEQGKAEIAARARAEEKTAEAAAKIKASKEQAVKADAIRAKQEAEKVAAALQAEKDAEALAAAELAKAEAESAPATEEAPEVSLEAVKAILMEFSRLGRQAEVKELLTSMGAARLSDIPADKRQELIDNANAVLVK